MITNGNIIDQDVPRWLDKDHLIRILKSLTIEDSDNFQILKFSLLNGNNDFKSTFFCEAWYCLGNETTVAEMIFKIEPEDDKEKPQFESEYKIYNEVIPRFEEILKNSGDYSEFGSKVLYSSEEKGRRIFVLENHINKDFFGAGLRYCSNEEAFISIEKIAKWHACSMKVYNEDPNFLETYVKGTLKNTDYKWREIVPNGLQMFLDFLDTQEDLVSFKPYFIKFKEVLNDKIKKLFSDNGRITVLNHGYFHAHNVLFKYADQMKTEPEDVVFVDFQLSLWASPVVDLAFIFNTFFNIEYRTNFENRNSVIKFYFDSLESSLKTIGYKGKMPTLKDLHKEFVDHSFFEVFFTAVSMPISMLFEEEARQGQEFMYVKNFTENYQNPLYIKTVKKMLPLYFNRGWLDFDD
ncbi:hypothetical protein ACFFRR_006100 [Megaselia abdita]